ncbi:MAG: protein-disulfide reductase DsbD domain-containing protein [Pseudomonadota bacterium]|nr:protein-disulfide reductase DsbD domain-containing protein [Pseudomonadota bacterium]
MLDRLSVIAALALALAAPSHAASRISEGVVTGHAQSALYPVEQGFAPGAVTWFVFEQTLQQGWHVYWKNPGDSGLPLDLQWTLPEGFEAGDVVYPTPERIPVGPLVNYGHHGGPAFLIPVKAPATAEAGSQVEIALKAAWLICEEICVPEEGTFSLTLPVSESPAADPAAAATAEAARAGAPEPVETDAEFSASPEAVVLSLRAPDGFGADGYFFPELEGLIEPAAAQRVERRADRLVVAMRPGFAVGDAGAETAWVLAFDDGTGAHKGYSFKAARSDTPIAPPATPVSQTSVAAGSAGAGTAGGTGLVYLLLAAFLGGVVLNVMPCVFPVIFIKAATLMKTAGAERSAIRRDGLLYAVGVVATFAALGGLLLVLRAGGEELGWGFHLQSPVVVLLSAYVLFLVGLNLAGVFHAGESLQGVGGSLAGKRGAAGSFFTGVLAVAVAAPCIGPFLTAPIGAAAFLPPMIGMLIFVLMGLGLAAPYLALSFIPRLGAMLPKPGGWMETFKQALAFPVFAGAAFFVWVLAQQTGPAGLARALGGAVLLAFAAWLFERSKGAGRRALAARAAALVAAMLALISLAGLRIVDEAQASSAAGGGEALAFDAAQIEALRGEGNGVFVDFTAAWCVTCQVNKLTVLSRADVAEAFAANHVTLMVADWTRRDARITEALAEFGANGVPLYVYYPPEGGPTVLPQPLTARAILDAVSRQPNRS